MSADGLSPQILNDIRLQCKTIAVVGLSPKPHRASYQVAVYLMRQGYEVIPVHPMRGEILGQKSYPDLASIPFDIDMVDCFRNVDAIPALADEAIAKGAKVLWMQLDIVHHATAEKARQAGMQVVMDRCPKIEYPMLMAQFSEPQNI